MLVCVVSGSGSHSKFDYCWIEILSDMSQQKACGPPLRSLHIWWALYKPPLILLTQVVWPLLQSPRQCCSRQLCGDIVFVFAVFLFLPFSGFFFFLFSFLFLLLEERLHRIAFLLLLLTFVMASSQMHCRWPQLLHSPKHIWVMALGAFSVTDVDLTNLITACSIPWPILVNGVPEVSRNQVLIMGTLKVRIPSVTSYFVLFDVYYCGTMSLTAKPRNIY